MIIPPRTEGRGGIAFNRQPKKNLIMKRTIVNIAAVLTALIVGLTINNACAEKIDPENPEEAPMTVGFFVEDGLLFGPDGKVYNKLKSISGRRFEKFLFNGQIVSETFSYDEKGRLSERRLTLQHNEESMTVTAHYKYSELKMTETVVIPENGTLTAEYYYHPLHREK